MKAWLSAAWNWIRRLPVAQYIRPLWTGALKGVIQEEGDALQAKLDVAIAQSGATAVDSIIDAWQAALKRRIGALPLPIGIELKLLDFIQVQGDILQDRLRVAIATGGPAAVDAAFDAAQAALIAKIDSL